jgi:hypothetical protein
VTLHSFDFFAKYGFDLKSTFSRPDQSTIVYHEDVDKKWIEMDGMKFTIDGSIKGSKHCKYGIPWTYCQSVDRQMGDARTEVYTTGLSSPQSLPLRCYRSAILLPTLTSTLPSSQRSTHYITGCYRSRSPPHLLASGCYRGPSPPPPTSLPAAHPGPRSTSTYLSPLCDCRCSDYCDYCPTTTSGSSDSSSSDEDDKKMTVILAAAAATRRQDENDRNKSATCAGVLGVHAAWKKSKVTRSNPGDVCDFICTNSGYIKLSRT